MIEMAADFAWWAGTAALGLDAPGRLERILPEAVQQADLAAMLGGDPPTTALLAWPSRAGGLMSCIRMGREGANNEFVVAWPFATTGVAHRMVIGAIHADEDCGALRLIQGQINDHSLVVLDSGCTFADARVGTTIDVRLHGWVARLEPAPTEPIRLHPDKVNDSMRGAFREAFERDGELVLHTDQLVAVIPGSGAPTPLYEFRAPVQAVREGIALPGVEAWTLTIAIFRSDDRDETLDIELTLTDAIWQGEPPQVGQPVQGLLWLQAAA